jgi:hypothetical protein
MHSIDPGISASSLDRRLPGETSNEGDNATKQSSVTGFRIVATRPSKASGEIREPPQRQNPDQSAAKLGIQHFPY